MASEKYDIVIVGAGFAGIYMLYKARELGFKAIVLEKGAEVGGTWYWNRYPGLRCDAESLTYSYSFSPELEQEWQWTERYAAQPEILKYIKHVADRFELRKDIRFDQKVEHAKYDEANNSWTVQTSTGDAIEARFVIMATGCLSVPLKPQFPGLSSFKGEVYNTSDWPDEPVDFSNKCVGVIGTGSSGTQVSTALAEDVGHLYVFQRTANYTVPARNVAPDEEWVKRFKSHYPQHREDQRKGVMVGFGDLKPEPYIEPYITESAEGLSDTEIQAVMEEKWAAGGAAMVYMSFEDVLFNPQTNDRVANFVKDKIKSVVHDPKTADALSPKDMPIGAKRICVDTGYYEIFNQDNVSLVDLKLDPMVTITENGIQTESGAHYELDVLVTAIGYDALTGAILAMDIVGEDGLSLKEKWAGGPQNYLGIGISGFPNLFTIAGAGTPAVFSNVVLSIEQHVEWISDCLKHMKEHDLTKINPDLKAEEEWVNHVRETAESTLLMNTSSWYLGANVPGKPRVFGAYLGGVGPYREICDEISADNYRGFEMS